MLRTRTLIALLLSLCALGVVAPRAEAQNLPQGLPNPDVIRQRIRESGLSADQIRSRLRASGYPDNLLDAYLGTGAPEEIVDVENSFTGQFLRPLLARK